MDQEEPWIKRNGGSRGMDQEEWIKRKGPRKSDGYVKGDQSSQKVVIYHHCASSQLISSKQGRQPTWNNELPRTFSFPYLAILSKRSVDWLARMPGLPGI